MTKFNYTLELVKVLFAYACVSAALIAPMAVAFWCGYEIWHESGSRIMGALSVTALSLPAILIGIMLSRFVAIFFIST